MRAQIRTRVELPGFQKFRAELKPRLDELVRGTAFTIEANAKLKAPVDTGALRASIYTETNKSSNKGKNLAAAEAISLKGRGKFAVNPAALPARPAAELTAIVVVGAEYGVYLEYGTSNMAARPYLTPAVEIVRGPFIAAAKALMAELVDVRATRLSMARRRRGGA